MRGAGEPAGRAKRPLWVSCSPTIGRAFPASAAAPSGARRSSPIASAVSSRSTSWCGFARPSSHTATASPPQTSPAPDTPKRRQRRRVSSPGRPSRVPSQPSIGCTTKRFGDTRSCPTSSEDASGDCGAGSAASSHGNATPSYAMRVRNAAASLSDAMRGQRSLTRVPSRHAPRAPARPAHRARTPRRPRVFPPAVSTPTTGTRS